MVKATQIPMKPPTDDKISKQMMLRIATTTESYHNKVVLNSFTKHILLAFSVTFFVPSVDTKNCYKTVFHIITEQSNSVSSILISY